MKWDLAIKSDASEEASAFSAPDIGKIVRNLILTHNDRDGVFPNLLDHFDMVRMIDYDGSQGRVGILQHKQTKEKVVFKIPLHPGFTVRHEHSIMNRLSGSRKFIPNYCEVYGLIKTLVSPDSDSPFAIAKGEAASLYDVLLTEYIVGSVTLTERIFSYNAKIVYSLIRQVLLAIEIGKRKYGLVHYDLHSDNILLRKCPRDSLFLYNMGNTKALIPTYGIYPVIIDFGFSYLKGQTGMPLYSHMSHTDAGYLACLFDPYYDARIFLMNVSKDLSEFRTQRETSFRNKVLAYYNHLSIDTSKGWDIRKGQYSASEMIVFTIEELEKEEKVCKFFDDEGYQCVNILQSLIELPLRNKKNGDFRPFYRVFIQQFAKFEKTVKSDHNKLLILVQLVESARKIRATYNNNQEEGVRAFRRDFLHYIDKSLTFYQAPSDVDYHLLLENMYRMADCIETVYFRVMKDIIDVKKEQYKKPVENMEIFDMVDVYYSTEYKLYPSSVVYVWDAEKEVSRTVTDFPDEFCDEFNDTKNRERAEMMWAYACKTAPRISRNTVDY
jgi:hypothetical protein